MTNLRAFLRGMGSVLDLFGTSGPRPEDYACEAHGEPWCEAWACQERLAQYERGEVRGLTLEEAERYLGLDVTESPR